MTLVETIDALHNDRARLRTTIMDLMDDVRHWRSLGMYQRQMMDQNLGWCPTQAGIDVSDRLLDAAASVLRQSIDLDDPERREQ